MICANDKFVTVIVQKIDLDLDIDLNLNIDLDIN
jgi:hypothetical protein